MRKQSSLILIVLLMSCIFSFAEDHPKSANFILLKGHFATAGGAGTSSTFNSQGAFGSISPSGESVSANFRVYSGIFTPLFSDYNSAPTITSLTANPSQDYTASSYPYTVTFDVTVTDYDDSIFAYSWDFGDGDTLDLSNQSGNVTVTHDYTAGKENGPYVVTCTVSDGTTSDSDTVEVSLGPQAPRITVKANPSYGPSPLYVEFTATAYDPDGGSIAMYRWNFGDGSDEKSGPSRSTISHTYTAPTNNTTVYTMTSLVKDNEDRWGSTTKEIKLFPALFFDDFEDGNCSDWNKLAYDDWHVVSDDTKMLRSASVNSARHIKSPVTDFNYGTISVDMKVKSSSSTLYKTGMIIWAFSSENNFRYVKADLANKKIIIGERDGYDNDLVSFNQNGWYLPLDTNNNITAIVRPDGSVKVLVDNKVVGEYDFGSSVPGALGLGTRKSQTFFDNFLVSTSTDANSPPDVTINPKVAVSTYFPTTINFDATATDPEGASNLIYFWRFGDGTTSMEEDPSHEFLYEGTYISRLNVTDTPVLGGSAATTEAKSTIHLGVDYHDNFNDNDISDWVVDTGTWSASTTKLRATSIYTNSVILSAYTKNKTVTFGRVCALVKVVQDSSTPKNNAMFVFGYKDLDSYYRFVKFDMDTKEILIQHNDPNSSEIVDAERAYPLSIGQEYMACVKVSPLGTTGQQITVSIDDEQLLTYNFSTILGGKWGVRSGKSKAQFDEFVIFDSSTTNSTSADIDTNITNHDFGYTPLYLTDGKEQLITISNNSPVGLGEDLTVQNMTTSNPEFTIEDPSNGQPLTSIASPIIPGGSVDVLVRYKPAAAGEDTAIFSIYSNDPDEPIYTIDLSGEGVASYPPTATITIDPSTQEGPAPLIVNFTAVGDDEDGDNSLIQYEWTFGDGSATDSNRITSHTYYSEGTYTATLVVTDETGMTNSYTRTISVDKKVFFDDFQDGDVSDWTFRIPANWRIVKPDSDWKLYGKNFDPSWPWDWALAPAEAHYTGEVIVEFDAFVMSGGNRIYYLFNFKDNGNYAFVRFRYKQNEWELGKKISGVETILASGANAGLAFGTWQHIKFTYENDIITVKVAGSQIFTYNYGTIYYKNNGLGIFDSEVMFNNYKVTFLNYGAGNAPPTLSIAAAPTTGYTPLEVTFTATGDDPDGNNAFLTYQWDFGDSSGTSSAQNPTYTYTSEGEFIATCTVTDSGMPPLVASKVISITTIEGNRPPDLTTSASPTMGAAPLSVTFTASATDPEGDGFTYAWDFGDGSAPSALQNPTHDYTADGTYYATCTVTDDGTPIRSSFDNITITVDSTPFYSENFDDLAADGWRYRTDAEWSIISTGDVMGTGGIRGSSNTEQFEFAIAPAESLFKDTGFIEVFGKVLSGNNGSDFMILFDFVNGKNYGYARMDIANRQIIIGKVVKGNDSVISTINTFLKYDGWNKIALDFSNGVITVYKWDKEIASGINYGTFSDYWNGLATWDSNVIFDRYYIRFTGDAPSNTPPTLSILADPTTGNAPLSVDFTANGDDPDGDNAALTYSWDFGDSTGTSTAQNPRHSYNTAGSFRATCVVTDSGTPAMTSKSTILISVGGGVSNTAPELNISASPQAGAAPLSVSFDAEATDSDGNDIAFLWSFGDGSSDSSDEDPTHVYSSSGTFTATCTATDNGVPAQSTTRTITITVDNSSYFLDDFEDNDVSNWNFRYPGNWQATLWNSGNRLIGENMNPADGWDYAIAPAAAWFKDTGVIEVETRIPDYTNGNDVYIIFDYVDENNFGYIRARLNVNKLLIVKVDNGIETTLDTTVTTLQWNVWNRFRLEFSNGWLAVSNNGTSITENINYGAFRSNKNGLAVKESKVIFDNYKITFTGIAPSNIQPTVEVTADKNSGSSPLQVNFSANGNDPDGNNSSLIYNWNFGDSSETSSQQNPSHTYTADGTFTAVCTVTDSGTPAQSNSDSVVISVGTTNNPPSLSINTDHTVGSAPLTVQFEADAQDPENDTISYEWDFGDNSPDQTSTLQNPTHTFTLTGTYNVRCKASDDGSPSMSTERSVKVKVGDYIYIDDFNDSNISDWTKTDNAWSTFNAGNGNYKLYGMYENSTIILAPESAEFKNGRILAFEYEIRSGMQVNKLKAGIIFNYVDNSNYSIIEINGNSSNIEVRKYIDGEVTTIHVADVSIDFDTVYNVELLLNNNRLTLEINDEELIQNVNHGVINSTQFGFWIEKSSVLFDNVTLSEN